ncbi:hypothetical protein F4V56_09590 [Corynebacterium spheniscorum]|nr:hypothetical protein F4V56_09590 [Corynebacterium spheniscorum]
MRKNRTPRRLPKIPAPTQAEVTQEVLTPVAATQEVATPEVATPVVAGKITGTPPVMVSAAPRNPNN